MDDGHMLDDRSLQFWTHIQRSGNCLDRYIPFRRKLNQDSVYCRMFDSPRGSDSGHDPPKTRDTPAREADATAVYKRRLSVALDQSPLRRVLSFSNLSQTLQQTLNGYQDCHPLTPSPSSGFESRQEQCRDIVRDPDRILAIPNIRDDFYSSTMDWGGNNAIALALGSTTFVWDAGTNTTGTLGQGDQWGHVSSVRWSRDSHTLAQGRSQGLVEFWDYVTLRPCDTARPVGTKQIGCLEWRGRVLYCGSRDGNIHIVDTRASVGKHTTVRDKCQRFEVTSLQLSPDETVLASGSDDGYVRLWCTRTHALLSEIDAHMSSIKAMAWCPWRCTVLATGGGCNDGKVVLWNRNTGQAMSVRETRVQTCALLWSSEYRELVSSHGYPDNNIRVWSAKDQELHHFATLSSHQGRPLHLALSPDKTTVASAGADESLCIWKLFPVKRNREISHSPINLFGIR
ncbi:uncharacterized protein LOC131951466 [Physella acuta]|uniref:uncharacterized protein LOC131951466 n=1 Tax=Physella acuta TaxID=109671 RepID=UPI0027DAD1E7|nr:uncharacterized protein LOC131951466 [Physella acuta]